MQIRNKWDLSFCSRTNIQPNETSNNILRQIQTKNILSASMNSLKSKVSICLGIIQVFVFMLKWCIHIFFTETIYNPQAIPASINKLLERNHQKLPLPYDSTVFDLSCILKHVMDMTHCKTQFHNFKGFI